MTDLVQATAPAGRPRTLAGWTLTGLFAWGGLWLRDARIRALLPIRR